MTKNRTLTTLSAIALTAALFAGSQASAQSTPSPLGTAPPTSSQMTPPQMPMTGQTQALPTRLDPEQAIALLRDAGYRANIVSQDGTSVDIETRMSGLRVYFSLLGCEANSQCRSAQLRMTADMRFFGLNPDQRSDIEAIVLGTNHWNSVRRFNRAYVYFSNRDRQHVVALEADLPFSSGVSADAVKAFVRQYDELAGEFSPFVRNATNRRLTNY